MSLIFSDEDIFQKGIAELKSAFGTIDFVSQCYPFRFTDYYESEMGKDLVRHFVTFEDLIRMESLPEIKLKTNRLEESLSSPEGKRRLNIDPGYICLHNVVLATTKPYCHRPYLRDGIYADLTMIYRNGSFRPLEWTYPDYRQQEIVTLFNRLRSKYKEDLKRRSLAYC